MAPVDERFLDQLQTGQVARVVADAFAGQPLAARVLSIAPSVDAQRGAIEVKLTLDAPAPAFLREDMTVSVEVETARRERALVVPVSALRGDEGAGPAVWVARDGRVEVRRDQHHFTRLIRHAQRQHLGHELADLARRKIHHRQHALDLWARLSQQQPAEALPLLPALISAADRFDTLGVPVQHRLRRLIVRHRALSE